MKFCSSPYRYQRRATREVRVGNPACGGVIIGGQQPIVIQSMITCDTMDTAACVRETLALAAVGCQLVRITAPTVKDAANLKNIVAELRAQRCHIPIAADIHFKPEAAMEAAQWVEKIRINPGNFADSKKFLTRAYTEDEYAAELERLEDRFAPLVQICRDLSRAMRIGANHGSLSDRILNRYGDTPLGMVQSALEFTRIARKYDFHNLVFSMKASNPKVTIEAYRLLAAKLEALGPDWNYPFHLGVTEAGEGEDGRLKSAVGIGSLLGDGLGDTIRVSLTEDSPHEIPVCRELIEQVGLLYPSHSEVTGVSQAEPPLSFDPFMYASRPAREVAIGPDLRCGGSQPVRVIVTRAVADEWGRNSIPKEKTIPEAVYDDLLVAELDPRKDFATPQPGQLVTVKDDPGLAPVAAFRLLAARLKAGGLDNPILLKDGLVSAGANSESRGTLYQAAIILGALLADGIGDAILIRGERKATPAVRLAYNILQASGCRSFKTDYVACPSCGRTLFHLQTVTANIKARTQHLPGVKIAIMGCIVNGPGEMADANFGYVGGAPGKVNLYVGKQPVKFNVPEAEAVNRLVDLIREHGQWVEPESPTSPAE